MPTRKTKDGGYRYGKTGKTYYGKGAKAKADELEALSLALRYIELIRGEESGLEKQVMKHTKEKHET